MKKALIFLISLLMLVSHSQAQSRILPMKPAELIAYLPPAPPEWITIKSQAADNLSGGWVTTSAVRSFKQPPQRPDPAAPSATPSEPVVLRVHLLDSGNKDDWTTMFVPKPSSPEATSSRVRYLKIQNFAAREFKLDDKTIILNILVKNRYLFEIRAANLEDEKVLRKYAESIDLKKLAAAPDSGVSHITNPVILSRVDELNPKKNRSYPLFWSTGVK